MTVDSNIVKFPYSASRRVYSRRPRTSKNGTPEAAAVVEVEARPTAKRDRRTLRGNPLRFKFAPISPAVTIVGKMHTAALRDEHLSNLHPDIIQQWLGELRRAAEHLLTQAKETTTREEIVEAYLRLSPELQQIADAKIREMIESES